MLDGLTAEWERRFRRMECEVDSKFVFDLLHNQGMGSNDFHSLVWSIRGVLDREWVVVFRHVYRERNRSADYMANVAIGVNLYEALTKGMLNIIHQDAAGICLPRLTLFSLFTKKKYLKNNYTSPTPKQIPLNPSE